MKFLFLLAALSFCAAADDFDYLAGEEEWVDFRFAPEYASSTPLPVECVRPGPMCRDCKKVYLCTNITGEWEAEEIDTCEGDQTCNNGACSDVPTTECALEGKDFACVSLEGVYPDPASCTDYHYCVPQQGSDKLEKRSSNCGKKPQYYYNPRTTYCDILIKGPCVSPIPKCMKPSQTGALKENPSLFYICRPYKNRANVLYPYLYRCPNGKPYDGNYNCK